MDIVYLQELGKRYLKRRCRLPLLVYDSSTAAAGECKTAGAAARRCRYFEEKKKAEST